MSSFAIKDGLAQVMLNSVPFPLALLDAHGVILAVNAAWGELGATGQNYLTLCEVPHRDGIRQVLAAEIPSFEVDYAKDQLWFRLSATRSQLQGEPAALVMQRDITGHLLVKDRLRQGEQEQRKLAEKLESQRTRLQEAQAIANMGSWETDLATLAVTWSDEVYRIFELVPDTFQLTHQVFLEFVHPHDREKVHGAFLASQGEQGPFSIRHRLLLKDGRTKYVEERWSLFFDKQGRAERALGTCQDISELLQAELEARLAHQNLASIVSALQKITAAELGLDELLDRMASEAQALTGASGSAVELINEDYMVYRAASGSAREHLGMKIPRQGSLSGLAVEAKQVLLCEDTESDPRVDREACLRVGIGSMLVAPLRHGQQVIGVLKVLSEQKSAFSQHQVANLQILVESLGEAIQRRLATDQLQASEAQYRLLFASNPHSMWAYSNSTLKFLAVNDAAVAHYGYTVEQFLKMTISDIHPAEEIEPLLQSLAETPFEREGSNRWHHHTEDGRRLEVELRSNPLLFDDQSARLVLAHDVSERSRWEREIARKNRALTILNQCDQALNRIEGEGELLSEVCRIIHEVGGYRMVWVGFTQEDEAGLILPVAHSGSETGYLQELQLSWRSDSASGQGPGGLAVRSGHSVVCEDIWKDSSFFSQEAARARGYRGCICLPLGKERPSAGVLILYSSEVMQTSAEELSLLEQLAQRLAFGIQNLRLRLERQRLHAAMLKAASAVSASSGVEFYQQLTHNMAEALGAQAALVAQMLPGDPPSARILAAVAAGRVVDVLDFQLGETPCLRLLSEEEFVLTHEAGNCFAVIPAVAEVGAEACVGRRLVNSAGDMVGLLLVVFRERLQESNFVPSMLRIFAAGAASELERQKQGAQMREQAALLDAAHEAIYVKDLQDRIVYWNRGAERLYGWTAAEALAQPDSQFLYPDPLQLQRARAELFLKGEWQGEMHKQTRQGRALTVEVSWTLVRDGQGEPKSVLAINIDISQKKEIEAQFLRAQRMESIGTLAGGIAHDLNNVLAPILMTVDILAEALEGHPDRDLLVTMENSARRGADLVKQVLSFARGVEGERILVGLGRLAEELYQVMRDTFPKSICLKLSAAADLWSVSGDPTQLHQVFLNLCVNARDAMPEGGHLTLSLKNEVLDETYAAMTPGARSGNFVVVSVEDTGSGISAETRDRIFEPFFTTKELGGGTGLGLSTTMAIVRSHEGFIRLDSQLGKGSTFKVYLPAEESALPERATVVAQAGPARGNGELLLVVDDEEAIRTVAQRTLEFFGYRVLLACHGAEAVSLFAMHRAEIAAVLTDMAMPIMDGPALIVALKSLDPKVRIIGSSGLSNQEDVARAAGAGVEHFLAKPYTAEALLETLQKILQAPLSHKLPQS